MLPQVSQSKRMLSFWNHTNILIFSLSPTRYREVGMNQIPLCSHTQAPLSTYLSNKQEKQRRQTARPVETSVFKNVTYKC